jgi:cytochrome bd-type quinol oxidase subunit 2
MATAWLQPEVFTNLLARPWSVCLVLLMFGGLGGVFYFLRHERELPAFLSSSAFVLGLLAATMTGNYPFWLRSTFDRSYGLTAENTASQTYALRTGLVWWSVGIVLAGAYFFNLFRSHRGKVNLPLVEAATKHET